MTESHNPPMNPANFLIAMVEVYCQWLNEWVDADETPDFATRYSVEKFLRYDPERGLYGQGEVKAVIPTYFNRILVEAVVTDGDDGGATTLTAWFDLNFHDGTNPLDTMVQGFDTTYQIIYSEGKLVNNPGKVENRG
jgi:hypothetical protein